MHTSIKVTAAKVGHSKSIATPHGFYARGIQAQKESKLPHIIDLEFEL